MKTKIESWTEYVQEYGEQQMVVEGNAQLVDRINTLMKLYLIYQTWIPKEYYKNKDVFNYNITYRINDIDNKPYLFVNAFDRGIFNFPSFVEARQFADLFKEELLKIKDLI